MNEMHQTGEKLRALPKAPSADPVGEVLQLLGDFVRDLGYRVEGTPEEDGLLQTIRPHQEAFRVAIRRTAPNFVPWKKTADKELPKAGFLDDEDSGDAGPASVAGGEDNRPTLPLNWRSSRTLSSPPRSNSDSNSPRPNPQLHRHNATAVNQSSTDSEIYIDEVLKRAQK